MAGSVRFGGSDGLDAVLGAHWDAVGCHRAWGVADDAAFYLTKRTYPSLYAFPRSVNFPSSSSILAHLPTVPQSLMGPNQAYRSTHSRPSRYLKLSEAKFATCSFGSGASLFQFVAANCRPTPTL